MQSKSEKNVRRQKDKKRGKNVKKIKVFMVIVTSYLGETVLFIKFYSKFYSQNPP